MDTLVFLIRDRIVYTEKMLHAYASSTPVRPPRGATARFAAAERRLLLAQPGIGERMLARLEQSGIDSIAALREQGVARIAAEVSAQLGTPTWRNRVRALERALAALQPPP